MIKVDIAMDPSFKEYDSSEAYKTLRTNLQFTGEENRCIAFTSCIPGEGKSSVSINTAISLAEAGKRVLFVDADMRHSTFLGKITPHGKLKGLSHYLSGMCSLQEVVVDTNIKNLNAIFAGPLPPNPAELLETKKFETLISELKNVFDYIIIDTPPLGSVIDAAVIAKTSRSAVIVVEQGSISYRFVQAIADQLKKADCNILGIVINKTERFKDKYYNGYYGKYYGKYYGDTYEENKQS